MSQHVNTILNACLDPDVYRQVSATIDTSVFRPESKAVFKVIGDAHEKFNRKLQPLEVYELHIAGVPLMTEAAKQALKEQYLSIAGNKTIGADVAQEVIQIANAKRIGETLMTKAVELENNPAAWREHLEDIAAYIEASKRNTGAMSEEDVWNSFEEFSVDRIVNMEKEHEGVGIAIPEFNVLHPVVPKGSFVIFGARVETGKSSFVASLCCLPGGFLDQKRRTLVVVNEEAAERMTRRYATVRTGVSKDDIVNQPETVREVVKEMNGYINLVDGTDFDLAMLEHYVKITEPDVVIVDLLDKIHMPGSFDRLDLKHEELYRRCRNLAKKYNFALFGGTQLNDNASDRLVLTLNMLKDSRTGKSAEADSVWLIGRNPPSTSGNDAEPDGFRSINLAKDKIDGRSGTICYVTLDIPTGRYMA